MTWKELIRIRNTASNLILSATSVTFLYKYIYIFSECEIFTLPNKSKVANLTFSSDRAATKAVNFLTGSILGSTQLHLEKEMVGSTSNTLNLTNSVNDPYLFNKDPVFL